MKKKVPTSPNKSGRTIFGALNLRTQKFYWKEAEKGNSDNFIKFLHQLHKAFPRKHIILILDNASIHKSKKVELFCERHWWIDLRKLAPYSTEYNPIEILWKWLKRKIYGVKSFKTIKELIGKLRKFVWHYNENRIVNRIKFEFLAYNELL